LEPYSALWNLEYPQDRRNPEEIGAGFANLKAGAFEENWVLEDDRAAVAVVSATDWEGKGEGITADVIMHPGHEAELFPIARARAEGAAGRAGVSRLNTWVSDGMDRRIELLQAAGYKNVQTVPVTRLDLEPFDPAPFIERVPWLGEALDGPHASNGGLRLTTMAELEAEGVDWVPGLYAATQEMIEDMPNPHPPQQMPIEQYRSMVRDPKNFDFEWMIAVMDGDRIVAYTRAAPSKSMPELARTGVTGTVRTHRRQGLATAVKVVAIMRLKEAGFKLLQTDNDETNPMYQLNLQLGFTDRWKWMHWEKGLGGGE
jgi:hypothetical protein